MTEPIKSRRKRATGGPGQLSGARSLPTQDDMDAYVQRTTVGAREHDLHQAQQLIYDAWEATTMRSRESLARKALTISPLCADAFDVLAGHARTTQEAHDLYALGLAAGERALGPRGFKEYAGEFWGFLETRPYMRARYGLATALFELGEWEQAVAHFRAMLELNHGDNQGIRYVLLNCLLERGDMPAVKRLLAQYKGECSTQWSYTRLLLAYRDGKTTTKATQALLKEAWTENPHVPDILAGIAKPQPSKDGLMALGSTEEATNYIDGCGDAWRSTPGAIEWLLVACAAAQTPNPLGVTRH